MKTKLQKLCQTVKRFNDGDMDARSDIRGRGTVSDLASYFNELADRYKASDEMRREFISNVSHDMKTPMTVINGYVSNIMSGAIPREQELRYLERIKNETMRLSGLVGLYLDVSRIDSGEWEFRQDDINITEIIGNNVSVFIDKLESKCLGGDFDTPGDVTVVGDSDAINRVMYCLVDNAVKFAPVSGSMDISVKPLNGKAVISISNSGEGIPYEDQPFVFDRSFKCDRSRGVEKDSFGLGLYICQKILISHNTELKLDSVPGEYTRFTFELPLSKQSGRR